MRLKTIHYVIVGVFVMFFGSLLITMSCSAASGTAKSTEITGNSYFDKALYEQIHECYHRQNSPMQNGFRAIDFEAYSQVDGTFYSTLTENDINASGYLPVITGKYNLMTNAVNCNQLLVLGVPGADKNYVFAPFLNSENSKVRIPNAKNESEKNYEKIDTFLTKMGYTKRGANSNENQQCVRFQYKLKESTAVNYHEGELYYTDYVCAEVENNTIISDNVTIRETEDSPIVMSSDLPYSKAVFFDNSDSSRLVIQISQKASLKEKGIHEATVSVPDGLSTWKGIKWNGSSDALVNIISWVLSNHQADGKDPGIIGCKNLICEGELYEYTGTIDRSGPSDAKYFIVTSNDTGSGMTAVKNISGISSYDNYDALAYTPDEKLRLYVYYFQYYYNSILKSDDSVIYCTDNEDKKTFYDAKTDEYAQFVVTQAGATETGQTTCFVKKPTKNKDESVNGLNGANHFDGTKKTFDQLIADLDNLILTQSLPGDVTNEFATISNSQNNADDTVCYKGSGAIGWLVCPLIKMLSGIGNRMWTSIERDFMIIPTEIFNDNGGVQQAWDAIRNIANIVFIILFLVVIFSQLTGVGIDNYGIKKILPRLIMVAILVNLSWIICELAADVSNIVGAGINDMLTGFAASIVPAGNTSTLAMITGGVGDVALTGGAAALFVLANGWNLAAVAALGLTILGVVITLVFAIIMMYLILIIREAGIILMIVLAPVAIVCYALPNTEKLSKRWLDISKALLVVYPLCGAAIGAGKLASAVLASVAGGDATLVQAVMAAINGGNLVELTNSVFAAASGGQTGLMLAAMIVQVLPFFFIPTLLRNSLSLMGNVGARISQAGRNLGRRASTGLQSGVRNSERFKQFQQYEQGRTAERRANRVINRLGGRTNLSQRQQNRLAKARDIALEERNKRLEMQRKSGDNYYGRMINEQDLAARQNLHEDEVRAGGEYVSAMTEKQNLEAENQDAVIAQYNRESFRDAKRVTMADEIRRQQSKERTTLMMNRYNDMGLSQLERRWGQIFRNDDNEYAGRDEERLADLDALTNVMTQRYGTTAAGSIGSILDNMKDVAGNETYQRSLRALQQTMNDNSAFAGNMKNKSPDAFQMISDAGMRYDKDADAMVYQDLSWFTGNNNVATQAKDWAVASGAALRRSANAVDDKGNYVMTDDVLRELLRPDATPDIRAGIQSEAGKREILEAEARRRGLTIDMSGQIDHRQARNNARRGGRR